MQEARKITIKPAFLVDMYVLGPTCGSNEKSSPSTRGGLCGDL